MRVSFDFDGVIGHRPEVQEYARGLLNKGIDVHITTRRYGEQVEDWETKPNSEWWSSVGSKNWSEVYDISDRLGIKRENIHFCNMEDKVLFFEHAPPFVFHLDDDDTELEQLDIAYHLDLIPVDVKKPDWEHACNTILKRVDSRSDLL